MCWGWPAGSDAHIAPWAHASRGGSSFEPAPPMHARVPPASSRTSAKVAFLQTAARLNLRHTETDDRGQGRARGPAAVLEATCARRWGAPERCGVGASGRGGYRWPPRAGRRRALVERRVQVLIYAYYIRTQRTLVTVRRAWPEVAGRGGCGLSKAAELCRGAQAHALVIFGSVVECVRAPSDRPVQHLTL